jgi:hypothetical protein
MDEIGVRVHIRDSMTLDDIGDCTAPGPVRPDDMIALADGHPYRVIAVLPVPKHSFCVPVLATRIALVGTVR